MTVYEVDLGVALSRPPRLDEYRRVIIAADSHEEAELQAIYMVMHHPEVVMVVWHSGAWRL